MLRDAIDCHPGPMTSATPPEHPARTPGAGARRQVLLVEDDAAVAELIRLNLCHRNFDVVVSACAEAARRRVEAGLPAVVLLDWELPDGSGLLLLRHWRSEERTCGLPVIMLTGRSSAIDVKAAIEAGVDDYVTKPCAMADLTNRVSKVIYDRRRGSPRQPG